MDVLNYTAQQLTDQARRFYAFAGIARSNPQDRFFLVMGKTGSGKSTFVSRCTGKSVTVGHGLYSCTSSMDVFSFTQGRRIHLVDTPGFNDTDRSDIETLGILATYLGASYANGVRIHGIIMLHPILDNRMPGWSMRNIEMMKAMCGFSSYDTVAIATTMCPDAQSSYDRVGLEQREDELLTEYRFLGGLVAQGATMFRHNDKGCRGTFEENVSAQRIVSFLTQQSDMHAPYILQLQRERINEGKTLGETAAGIVVAGDLYKAPREHERQLRATEKALKEQELHDMEESMREIRDDMSWRSLTPNRKKQAAQELKEHEGIVNSARQELTEVRDARDEFSRQTGNIVNGIINGISSGVATGVITAVLSGAVLCIVM